MTTAIQTHDLTRHYSDLVAVDALNISIEAGAIYALLGPNGAGKTTALSMMTTLMQPTEGTATVAGFDVIQQAAEVRRRIGVTFQEIVLDKDLKGREVLDYHGQLYGMSRTARQAQIERLLALVEMEDAADRLTRTYSGGMKRRLELARGLMTEPEILFLDEPTQGLDPQNRAQVWQYLEMLSGERGLTILLTTHYMEEAEALADRVGIIDGGRLVAEGTTDELTARIGDDVIRVSGHGGREAFIKALDEQPYTREIVQANGLIQVGIDNGNQRLPAVVGLAADTGFEIEDISVARPGLGDVFLKVTGRALRD